MNEAGVPEGIQDLIDRKDRLILWAIRRAARRRLAPDDVQEFRQQVYLRIIEYRFLERCHLYFATRPGHFNASLLTLVRRVVWKQARRARTDPLGEADWLPLETLDTSHRGSGASGVHRRDHGPAVEARDTLEKVAQRLDRSRRRTSVRRILAAALRGGLHSGDLAQATGGNASAIRHALVAIRAELRRMEADDAVECTLRGPGHGDPA